MSAWVRSLMVFATFAASMTMTACPKSQTPSTLDPISAVDHERFFGIANGTKHEDVDCISCHTSTETFRTFDCLGCHEHRQEAMDGTHAGFDDYKYESPRCYACHPKGDVAAEVDHDQFFPIRGEVSHAPLSCADCHKDPANRANVSCTACHEHEVKPMYVVHHDMPNYLWSSTTCLTCHPNGEPIGAMEHPFFPTSVGTKHEGNTCKDCHASQENRHELACITCHEHEQEPMDAKHVAIVDYMWESSSCFMCHPNGEPVGTLQHTDFPIGPGVAHEEVTCIECHANPETRSEVACTTCHTHNQTDTAATHTGVPDYAFDSQACLFCHPNGEPDGIIDHTFFPIVEGTAHDEVTCVECHIDSTDRARVGCIECHEHEEPAMGQVHAGIPSYAWDSPSCLACHPSGEPIGAIDHTFFPIAPPAAHGEVDCAACHLSTQDRKDVGCTSCHEHRLEAMNPIHNGMLDYQWASPACLTCHPSAQPIGLLDHVAFPTEVGTKHEGLDCIACHAQQTQRDDLACTTCHDHRADAMDPVHLDIPNYFYESSSCFLCHPNAEPIGTMTHDAFFPIDPPAKHEGIECIACHTNPTTRADVGCITCHEHEQQPMATAHDGVPGYLWSSASCLLCHPNAEPVGNVDHEALFPIAPPAAHQGLDCVECHQNPNVQNEIACISCHLAGDMNPVHTGIPSYTHSSASCFGCHARAEVPGTLDHEPFFPIVAPSQHAAVSCAECHASQTDRSQLSCATCHTAAETNPQHTGVPGYLHASASCFSCHPNGDGASGFDHAPYFPIATGSPHGEVTCADCHTNPNNQNEVGCATCHEHEQAPMNASHVGVPGYTWSSPACLTCHPYAQVPGLADIDHEPFFPIALGTDHDGESCASCHLNPNDITVNGCRECHTTTMNIATEHVNAVKNATTSIHLDNSSDCKKCHADSQVHLLSTHGPFIINSGAHKGLCLDCHLQLRVDKPYAVDFEQWSCIDCHEHSKTKMDDKHNGENGYSWTNAACIECHPNGKD
jgi:hypothetical protein